MVPALLPVMLRIFPQLLYLYNYYSLSGVVNQCNDIILQ